MSATVAERPTLNVLVYDDEENSAASIKERLEVLHGLSVDLLPNNHEAVDALERRRREARTSARTPDDENVLDTTDILVVDYDLTADPSSPAGAAETGERVAYLARCYSSCKTIVALNQFDRVPTFDMTLTGHPGSFADLNINGELVDNPGLWGEPHDGFLPWTWPDLRQAPALQRAREALLKDSLDRPVLEVLGLSDAAVESFLTRRQLSWLGPRGVTVERAMRRTELGLRPRDEPWGRAGVVSVAAARLSKWLERIVLPGQNVLVDAPHLVARYPSLLRGSAESLAARGPAAEVPVDHATLDRHRYSSQTWLSRPAWYWPRVSDDHAIPEVADPFAPVPDELLFAEDSSRFRGAADVRPFTSDVEPFSRRFATRLPDADERDRPPYAGPHGLAAVAYEPLVAFAQA